MPAEKKCDIKLRNALAPEGLSCKTTSDGGNFIALSLGISSHSEDQRFVALSLEFRLTLKIIAKMLCEVVNRVKLCGHHTVRCSHVEVQSRVEVRR